jgi:Holliday junction resolvasome RuvABC DNA-binding subunit
MPDKYTGNYFIISSMKCYNKEHAVLTLGILGYSKVEAESYISKLLKEYFNERS